MLLLFDLEASFYCLSGKRERNLNFLKGTHRVFWYIDGHIDQFFDGARRKPDRYLVLSSLRNCHKIP